MKKLFDGVKEFSKKEFENNKELFKKLSGSQQPHTLFIGCSDSRVVPGLITKSLPGDLFVVRNIANVVPYYRSSEEYLSTTSAIEYAVLVLNVKNIVICGHSNCGGCRALFLDDAELEKTPHTKKWLKLFKNVKDKILTFTKNFDNLNDIEWLVEQENIIEQMNHLFSYPFIEEKYKKKQITIYGWYFHIGTGIVYNYNIENKTFDKIE